MNTPLVALRSFAQPSPSRFLAWHPGCWVQYYDDTATKDPSKALSARSFDLDTARRKQRERCAVCFSLQVFGASRTKEGLLCFRNLGVDVDLVAAPERGALAEAEIDRRKDEYLRRRLLPFPLKPHWLTETRHGFHAVFRVQPQRDSQGIRAALALNARLVRALGGDANAVLLTQVLRVPGTVQYKDPRRPFLCLLLLDNAGSLAPYPLDVVRSTLDAWEVFHGMRNGTEPHRTPQQAPDRERPRRWRDGLGGVPEGHRNATAASIVGGILGRLPEELWETAGWGGLKEWNQRNTTPLPERELRSVYESIARRERSKRGSSGQQAQPPERRETVVRVEVRIGTLGDAEVRSSECSGPPAATHVTVSPSTHAER